MDITYHEENGYLIPNIVIGYDTSRPIVSAQNSTPRSSTNFMG